MELPVNQLMDIISSDELNVRSEEQVFSAVMAWVKYNVTERRPYLAQVCCQFAPECQICTKHILTLQCKLMLTSKKNSCNDSLLQYSLSFDVLMVHLSSLGAILQVLEHVRLPLLSPKFLVGTVGSDLLIKSDEVNSFMGSYIFSFILCRFNGKIYCKEL